MTSKDIYFTPTYLYIKRHSVTGKLYFGKTIRDPETYFGSGLHWKRHIEKHGKDHVETLWYCLFIDKESCPEFALNFSEQRQIVESKEWLNVKPENGLDGCAPGSTWKCSLNAKKNFRISNGGANNSQYGTDKSGNKNPMFGRSVVFDLVDHRVKTIDSDEFRQFKNVKYVGANSSIAKKYKLLQS